MTAFVNQMMLILQEATESGEFTHYVEHLGYVGIFLWFTTLDQLTPVPEEITLLTIGYLAANHIFNPVIAGSVAFISFVAVDVAYYLLARSGHKVAIKIFERKKGRLMNRYIESLQKDMSRSLFILCFIPRMRLFGPILVGTFNLSFRRFLLTDITALSLLTALYTSLGVFFHKGLQTYLEELESLRHFIFIGAMVVIGFITVLSIRKYSR